MSFDEEPCWTALHMAEFLGGVPRYPKLHPCGLDQSSAASEPPATAADTLHRSATPPSATNADTTNAAIVAVQCQEIRQSSPSSGRVILLRCSVGIHATMRPHRTGAQPLDAGPSTLVGDGPSLGPPSTAPAAWGSSLADSPGGQGSDRRPRWRKAAAVLFSPPLPLLFKITALPIRYCPIKGLQKSIIAIAVGQCIALLKHVLVLGIKFGIRISSASSTSGEKQCLGDLVHRAKFLAASQDGSDNVRKIEHKARWPNANKFGEQLDFVAVLARCYELAESVWRRCRVSPKQGPNQSKSRFLGKTFLFTCKRPIPKCADFTIHVVDVAERPQGRNFADEPAASSNVRLYLFTEPTNMLINLLREPFRNIC